MVPASHSLQAPTPNNVTIAVIPKHVTASSSQPVTSSQHKSLRRIVNHDQTISLSPRRLRSHPPSSQ